MIFSLMLMSVKASALEICGDIKQGEVVLIKAEKAKKIRWFGKDYELVDAMLPVAIERDAAKDAEITVYFDEKKQKTYKLQVVPAKWNIQRINGVAKHHVAPDKKHQQEIVREQKELQGALAVVSKDKFWHNGFMLPLEGKISGEFGNQRVFNGVPKSPHNGVDIAAPLGTPVKVAGDGVVVLSGKNYFYTGNMVVVEHGQGLHTVYAHLQSAEIKVGDIVQKGDIIGYVGQTGRATGAHLHWGAVWHNIRFRPQSLLDLNNKKCLVWGEK